MNEIESITFLATLVRITTTDDGGWRVTLDVPSSDGEACLKLARQRGQVLQLAVLPTPTEGSSGAARWQR